MFTEVFGCVKNVFVERLFGVHYSTKIKKKQNVFVETDISIH